MNRHRTRDWQGLLYRRPLPNIHAVDEGPLDQLLMITAAQRAESLVRPPTGFALKIIKDRHCATPANLFAEFA